MLEAPSTSSLIPSDPCTPQRERQVKIIFTPSGSKAIGYRVSEPSLTHPARKLDFGSPQTRTPQKRSQSAPTASASAKNDPCTDVAPAHLCVNPGFSYWDEGKKTFKALSAEEEERLKKWVQIELNASKCDMVPPYLLVWARENSPPLEERPFMVADLLLVYLEQGEKYPSGIEIGELGEGDLIGGSQRLLESWKNIATFPTEVDIDELKGHFPQAMAISVVDDSFLVEFEEMDDGTFSDLVDELPEGIAVIDGYPIRYLNGLLDGKEKLMPRVGTISVTKPDYNDYLQSHGTLVPGVYLQGLLGQFTCSVLLEHERTRMQRLLVPWHCCFDDEDDPAIVLENIDTRAVSEEDEEEMVQMAEKAGKSKAFIDANIRKGYRIRHGNTHIGNIVDRIEKTDFALVELFSGIRISNEFLGSKVTSRRLVRSNQITRAANRFTINSFVSDKQSLLTRGKRWVYEEEKPDPGAEEPKQYPSKQKPGREPTMPGTNVAIHQNRKPQIICTTGNPDLRNATNIHGGVCGSVLLNKCALRMPDRSELGELLGIMHCWADQQDLYSNNNSVIALADAFDPLIDAGWKVAGGRDSDDVQELEVDAEMTDT